MEKICLDGNYEDIELKLSLGKMILAQAKAVEKRVPILLIFAEIFKKSSNIKDF